MRVFLAGGSGVVGRALIPLLVEKGIITESELREKARELGVAE